VRVRHTSNSSSENVNHDHTLHSPRRKTLGLSRAADGRSGIDPLGPYAFDPGPGFERILWESPEQRAFRRFPISSHKPGPG
jgi:hypothetical protein